MTTTLLGQMMYHPSGSNTDGMVFNTSHQPIGTGRESWTGDDYGELLYRAPGGRQFNLFWNPAAGSSFNKFLAGGQNGATILNIYKGTRPPISTITNLNNFSNDLLISFPIPSFSTTRSETGFAFEPQGGVQSNGVISPTENFRGMRIILGISPTFVGAQASGTATWFWFGNSSNLSNLSEICFVTGTVGVTGANCDLEIASATIAANSMYKSMGFAFYIPALQ